MRLMQPLVDSPQASVSMLSAVHRLHLSTGNLPAAGVVLARLAAHPDANEADKVTATALGLMAAGDTARAELILSQLVGSREGTDEGIIVSTTACIDGIVAD